MRGLGALSNAHLSTSKLVANRPTCFYGNSKDGRLLGLTQRNPSFAAAMLSSDGDCRRQISDLCDYCFSLILTFNLSLILTSALTLSPSLISHLLSPHLILVTSCSSLCFSIFRSVVPSLPASIHIGQHNPDLSSVSNRVIRLT